MGLTSHLTTSDRLSFFAWNIHGITSKSLGNKLQSTDFLDIINGSDFIIRTETWKSSNVDITGYRSIIQDGVMSKNGGRNSGGIILLYKNVFHDWISIVKTSPNFFCSKSTNITPKQRKISTHVIFIFHQLPQIILIPKFLKNSKRIY